MHKLNKPTKLKNHHYPPKTRHITAKHIPGKPMGYIDDNNLLAIVRENMYARGLSLEQMTKLVIKYFVPMLNATTKNQNIKTTTIKL